MSEAVDPAAAVAALQALLAQTAVATDPDAGLLRPGEARALLRDALGNREIPDPSLQNAFERLRDGNPWLGVVRRGRVTLIPLSAWRTALNTVAFFAAGGAKWESAVELAMESTAKELEEARERRPIRHSFGEVA